ncbi:FAD-dependent monooxygenase [Phyllobacterium sp. UNC302MFCol5.2]|uniref:FAD-dependent oxidoreductase n=1 Tax=Phyllobacterium sp. UNC302MFCol5.2 TaxID=1449065 RepID=UPI001FD8BBE4|nr:FAD-dependent monooxygenase [Phyllobacterium sp. UNC302MFCol5.2]
MAVAPGQGIQVHREPGGVLHAYVGLVRTKEWIDTIDFSDPVSATARVVAEFDGWHPALKALITDGDKAPVLRAVHALPQDHRWSRRPGVTLLGDAAHLMPPSGEGANLAMIDAAELGNAIAKGGADTEVALSAYEKKMLARSTIAAKEAAEAKQVLYGENTPQTLLDFFDAKQAAQ